MHAAPAGGQGCGGREGEHARGRTGMQSVRERCWIGTAQSDAPLAAMEPSTREGPPQSNFHARLHHHSMHSSSNRGTHPIRGDLTSLTVSSGWPGSSRTAASVTASRSSPARRYTCSVHKEGTHEAGIQCRLKLAQRIGAYMEGVRGWGEGWRGSAGLRAEGRMLPSCVDRQQRSPGRGGSPSGCPPLLAACLANPGHRATAQLLAQQHIHPSSPALLPLPALPPAGAAQPGAARAASPA